MSTNMIIAIDFDGTITDHEFPKIGKPNPDAIDWMKKFIEAEAQLIIHTMRSDQYLQDAIDYLDSVGLSDLYGYNTNPDQINWTTSPKTYAHIYIDDSAVGCPLVQYPGFNRPCVNWSIVGPAVLAVLK